MFGITTIRQGDRVAIWNRAGAVRFVDGPRRVWTLGQAVHRLTRHRAEATEYLAVRHTDGTVQHRPGPVTAWFDPVKHDRIEQHEQVVVEPDAAVVVYQRDDTATPPVAGDDAAAASTAKTSPCTRCRATRCPPGWPNSKPKAGRSPPACWPACGPPATFGADTSPSKAAGRVKRTNI